MPQRILAMKKSIKKISVGILSLMMMSSMVAPAIAGSEDVSSLPILISGPELRDKISGEEINESITSVDIGFSSDYDVSSLSYISDVSSNQDGSISLYSSYDGTEMYILSDSKIYAGSSLSGAFKDLRSLTDVRITNIDTTATYDMSEMFKGDVSLEGLDLTYFNTSSVSDMTSMFDMSGIYTEEEQTITPEPEIVEQEVILEDGSVTTEIVEVQGDSYTEVVEVPVVAALEGIIVTGPENGFSTESVEYSDNMFLGCENLVGGYGFAYDANCIDAAYATLDGYLTLSDSPMPLEITHTITYNDNGVALSVPNDSIVNDGETATYPGDATVEDGFQFTGWFLDPECTQSFSFDETPITEDITLYAGAEKKIQYAIVKFDNNGHGSYQSEQQVVVGQTVSQPGAITAEGFTFNGWYTETECVNKFDFATPVESDMTLYAGWTPDETPTEEPTEAPTEQPTEAPTETPTEQPTETTAAEITVAFKMDGGEPQISKATIHSGDVISEPSPAPTKSGYKFLGWFVSPDSQTSFDFSKPITSDTIIYAHWEEEGTEPTTEEPTTTPVAEDITITFNLMGGGDNFTKTIKSGEKVVKPDTPTRENFTFVGWFTDESLKTEFNFDSILKANTTVYAKWEQTTFTVTFNMGGHGSEIASKSITKGNLVDKPTTPTADGWTFEGWYTDGSLTQVFDFATKIEKDTTIYAKWSENKYFTVKFMVGTFATAPESQSVLNGQCATQPTNPTSTEYTFGGWYSDSACTQAFDFSTPITQDTTLYARWLRADGTVVQTGDNTNITTWVIIGAVAAVVIAGATVLLIFKKKNSNI